MKIGLVGDLSNGDGNKLLKCLDAALAVSDCVVQLGDLNSGDGVTSYQGIKQRIAAGAKLYPVPGNHDVNYDTIGCPRQWRYVIDNCTLTGIDNSADMINEDAWNLLTQASTGLHFVFAHKSPIPLIILDAAGNVMISQHIMGEGQPNQDADRLVDVLTRYADSMAVGHYHGFTIQRGPWGDLICEGRGGADPAGLFYSLIITTGAEWVLHTVPVT